MKQEKVKSIVISPNADYVMWEVNLDGIVRDTELSVQAGCFGMYIVNGILKSQNMPGRWLIKSKEEEKNDSRLQLIAVNSDKVFTILCGVGGVPYKDWELNIETLVGARGECKIRVMQPWLVYSALGTANVTVEQIDEYVRTKLCEYMKAELSEALQKYDYQSIMSKQTQIAEDLEKKFASRFSDIGIQVESFALIAIHFKEEYQEKRDKFYENANRKKEEKEERRAKEREEYAKLEAMTKIAEVNSKAGGDKSVDDKTNANTYICPRCKTPNAGDASYCKRCGAKLF